MARENLRENTIPPRERIDSSDGKLITISVAALEFLQGIVGILPFIGIILAPIFGFIIWLIIWMWLKLHGVGIGDNVKRMMIMFSAFFLELIPGINILPIWTLTIFVTILLVQNSDKRKIKEFYENFNKTTASRKMGYNINTLIQRAAMKKEINDNQEKEEFKEAA